MTLGEFIIDAMMAVFFVSVGISVGYGFGYVKGRFAEKSRMRRRKLLA